MIMDETRICQTCLSCDRVLFRLKTLESLLKNVNISINSRDPNTGVCWECKAIIIKFSKFKTQVSKAQTLITSKVKDDILSNLKSYTKCIYDCSYNYDRTDIDCEEEENKKKPVNDEKLDSGDNHFSDNDFNNEVHSNCDTNDDNICENEEKITKNKPKKRKKGSTPKIYLKKLEKEQEVVQKESRDKDREVRDKIEKVIFTEEEMLRNREQKRNQPNFKKIPFKCDSCVLGFTRNETYLLHLKKKHDESLGPHKCDVCSVRFPSSALLWSHRQRHYAVFRCLLCKYEAALLKAAVNHCVVKHENDKRGVIHCRQCPVTVGTAEELSEHINKNHMLECDQCGEKFKGKHTLRTHKTRIHSSNRAFTCDVCTKTFNTKSRLESHIISHNNTIAKKLAYCCKCKIQYKNIYIYRNHLKNSANHSERLYHCKECNKKFASKVYWRKHCDFYHLHKSPFKCHTCNKLFMSKWRLKNHRQKHHGLSRTRDHTCNICGKMFYTLSTLRGHQLTHSEKRSYMCTDCGDTFKQRPALYTHTRLVHKRVKQVK